MSGAKSHDQSDWEYCRLLFPCRDRADDADEGHVAPEIAEDIVQTLGSLDEAAAGGWRVLSVKIEEDAEGRSRLNVQMKRPKSQQVSLGSRRFDPPNIVRPHWDIDKAA